MVYRDVNPIGQVPTQGTYSQTFAKGNQQREGSWAGAMVKRQEGGQIRCDPYSGNSREPKAYQKRCTLRWDLEENKEVAT